MKNGSTIVLLVVAGFFFIFLFLATLFIRNIKKRIRETEKEFSRASIFIIEKSVNFFGQESLGLKQIRGNGVLLLTKEELYFRMWVPQRELKIPLHSIIEVKTTKKHLGKTKLKPLLKVVFKNKKGRRDSCAWLVSDITKWTNAISRAIK